MSQLEFFIFILLRFSPEETAHVLGRRAFHSKLF